MMKLSLMVLSAPIYACLIQIRILFEQLYTTTLFPYPNAR